MRFMQNKRLAKKAIFLSLSALLLGLVIVNLAFLASQQYIDASAVLNNIYAEKSIHNLFNSIEYGLNKLMRNSGWDFKLNTSAVSITQILPTTTYDDEHSAYVDFINDNTQANYTSDDLLIKIYPQNISYTNPTARRISIEPTTDMQFYDVNITVNADLALCDWLFSSSGDFPVHIVIKGNNGVCETTQSIDDSSTNVYGVTDDTLTQIITISISGNVIDVLFSAGVDYAKVIDTLGLNNAEKLVYESDTINITSETNINLSANPRVYA